jgi:DNA modification methylase
MMTEKLNHLLQMMAIGLQGRVGRAHEFVWSWRQRTLPDQCVGLCGCEYFKAGRMDELSMHPTVKPVALVADAIRDCSKRGQIVLDPFAGSGTTLIAAEKTGRRARLIEFDPAYCDSILRRFAQVTGKQARLAATGEGLRP